MSLKKTWLVLIGCFVLGWANALPASDKPVAGATVYRTSTGSATYAVQVLGQEAASKPGFFEKMKRKITATSSATRRNRLRLPISTREVPRVRSLPVLRPRRCG